LQSGFQTDQVTLVIKIRPALVTVRTNRDVLTTNIAQAGFHTPLSVASSEFALRAQTTRHYRETQKARRRDKRTSRADGLFSEKRQTSDSSMTFRLIHFFIFLIHRKSRT
jgi:hypothetical protein